MTRMLSAVRLDLGKQRDENRGAAVRKWFGGPQLDGWPHLSLDGDKTTRAQPRQEDRLLHLLSLKQAVREEQRHGMVSQRHLHLPVGFQ